MQRRSPNKKNITTQVTSSITLLLNPSPEGNPQPPPTSAVRILKFPRDAIKKELQVFCWRYKTYLPIVKPQDYNLVQDTHSKSGYNNFKTQPNEYKTTGLSPQKHFPGSPKKQQQCHYQQPNFNQLQVIMQPLKCRLSDITSLSFSQILYLLKEMMIGYDALIDIFGTFQPREEMIAVSNSCQWKIWIHQDFYHNCKEESSSIIGSREFIFKLLSMAEKHCQVTNLSKIFFCQMKEFTFSNECGFIKIFQRIKDFIKVNKIFQVNKVTLPGQQKKKSMLFESFSMKNTNLNSTQNFGRARGQHKLKAQKKLSIPCNTIYEEENPPSFSKINKTSMNIPPQRSGQPFHFPKQYQPVPQLHQVHSQKNINNSSMFYYPTQSPTNKFQSPTRFAQAADKWNSNNSSFLQPFTPQAKKTAPFNFTPKSPQVERPSINVFNMSKSRHQLKVMINEKDKKQNEQQSQQNSSNFLAVPQVKNRKNQRKYSQQVFKAKSTEVLKAGVNKVRGSQFYVQDPQRERQREVNVIKKKPHLLEPPSPKSPNMIKNHQSSNKTTVKDPGSSTPNHSSNSTNQFLNSSEKKKTSSNYKLLKMNDLNSNKARNNQSSYYGMGNYPNEQRKDKNMTISYEFKNRNEVQSKSSESTSKKNDQNQNGNNWNKKLSGLFSDDNSIKQLKQSVKFKTAEQKHFEKEYLKDVKLEMLDKLGKQVRYSIADDDDDFDQKNPYKSMQLIQEVADEGKSYIQKEDDKADIEEQDQTMVRGRNKTVQLRKNQVDDPPQKIVQKQCFSVECSENSSEDCFNFESQGYNLTRI